METNKQFISYICSMVPYGLKVQYNGEIYELYGVANNEKAVIVKPLMSELMAVPFNEIKTYLRQMSSMTEDEKCEHYRLKGHSDWQAQDYLDSIHVDYRGLIWKGLSLKAPEGMYEK